MLALGTASKWILTVIVIGLAVLVARQCRRPTWLVGRALALLMNRTHASLTDWGLRHLDIDPHATILDVGCGGGATIKRLASAAAAGKVYGVDLAPASVATARRTNRALIAAGRVDVRLASVSALPFPADMFDLVTAVETHYYWPDLHDDLREILRVLKPGGRLLILAEAYRGARGDWLMRPAMALLGAAYLTTSEHRGLFEAAGFVDVRTYEDRAKGWIGVRGSKGEAAPNVAMDAARVEARAP